MEQKGPMHTSIVSRILRIGHNINDDYTESVYNGKFPVDQHEHFNRPFRMLPPEVQALAHADDPEIVMKLEYFGVHALGPDATAAERQTFFDSELPQPLD